MTSTELKSIRQGLGLSQSQLAQRLGVHRQTISKWERGQRAIPSLLRPALEGLRAR